MGFTGGTSGKEPTCQFRKHKTLGFDPWVGKVPWRRAQQPTPVFWPGESHRQRSLTGMKFTDCSSLKSFFFKNKQKNTTFLDKIHVDKQFSVYAKKSLGKFIVNTGLLLLSIHISSKITILDGLY